MRRDLRIEAAGSPEMLVTANKTTRRHTQEESFTTRSLEPLGRERHHNGDNLVAELQKRSEGIYVYMDTLYVHIPICK
jgi:hypothetical protein